MNMNMEPLIKLLLFKQLVEVVVVVVEHHYCYSYLLEDKPKCLFLHCKAMVDSRCMQEVELLDRPRVCRLEEGDQHQQHHQQHHQHQQHVKEQQCQHVVEQQQQQCQHEGVQ